MSGLLGIGVGAVGFGGEPSRTHTRPDLCAGMGHPGCTYNPWADKTWCLCGAVVVEGNTADPHLTCSCCDSPPLTSPT